MRELWVSTTPVAKGRPRVGLRGHMYTPTTTKQAEYEIRQAWYGKHGDGPFDGDLEIKVGAYLPRPKSHFGTGKNAGQLRDSARAYPGVKPDLDNLLKLVVDALNGLAFIDDGQIVLATAYKQYADLTLGPGWSIVVKEILGANHG